jgi:hypothetical protein
LQAFRRLSSVFVTETLSKAMAACLQQKAGWLFVPKREVF